jgi:tryptophan-rich sensory protein
VNNALKLVVAVALPLLVGGLSGAVTARSVATWYPTLVKPSFNPPPWIFGPVWTVLYVAMGVAAFLVWRRGLAVDGVRAALVLFLVQLALNGLWTLLFFGLRSPAWAFAEILVLWLLIGATTWAFWRVSPTAGALMLPYWAWVSFATVLNGAIWRLNP